MKKIVFFILSVFLFRDAFSSSYFSHISVENGLSQTTLQSIYQDEFGRLWFGTRDGLNCYDGNKISIFRPRINDATSIFGNNIPEIAGNKNGALFLRCKYGLVKYDLRQNKFITIKDTDIYAINYGTLLWVCTGKDIYMLNEKDNSLTKYSSLAQINSHITYCKELSNKQLWVGTFSSGLYLINENRQAKQVIPDIGVYSIYEDSKHNIWVCTRENGLFLIANTGEIENFTYSHSHSNCINSNVVRCITEDKFGYYWIGTMNGLNRFDMSRRNFSQAEKIYQLPQKDAKQSVISILRDDQGSIWTGTYHNGAYYFNPEYEIYKSYFNDELTYPSIKPVITRMMDGGNGIVWMCTEGYGLGLLNCKTGSSTFYRIDSEKQQMASSHIKSILFNNDSSVIWVGTIHLGLYKFDIRTKRLIQIPDKNPKHSKSIRNISEYKDYLYLGTHTGILVYDKKRNSFSKIESSLIDQYSKYQVVDMTIDCYGNLWFSNSVGVFCYNLDNKSIHQYTNLEICGRETYNYVNCIFQDSNGRIWFGTTGDGIFYYDNSSQSFKNDIVINDLYPNSYVLAINESKMGYIWIATNNGLHRLDATNNHQWCYKQETGFPQTSINEYGILITDDDEVFVSGSRGLVSFNEKSLNYSTQKFNIYVAGLEINNRPVKPMDDNNILKESPLYQKNVNLEYRHKVITLEIATTNHIDALNAVTQYRLKGLDDIWVNIGNKKQISYTNLMPGKYTLQFRIIPESGEPYSTDAFFINIAPHPFLSWWAIVFYITAGLLVVIQIVRFYSARIKLQSSLALEKKDKENIESLNKTKQTFFINVAHELRTPLTLILGNIDFTLQTSNLPPAVHKKIQATKRNADRMNTLISELLEFSKIESNSSKVVVSCQNIVNLLKEVYQNFKEYSIARHINFQLVYDNADIDLYFNFNQLEKVFYNLISNAFNYTPENGNITITIHETDYEVHISVKDTGAGIPIDQLGKIFDQFYQIEHSERKNKHSNGSGIGLHYSKTIVESLGGRISVRSQLDKGSNFTVTLLKGYTHINNVEIVNSVDRDRTCLKEVTIPEESFFNEIISLQESSNNATILIVEDNPEVQELLVEIFKPIYKVITACNGQEGIVKSKEYNPDLILSDVMMPIMSGTTMCSALKKHVDTCHIPIVLLTAKAAIDYTLEGLRNGADDYITKPFNSKELVARCNNLIQSRRIMQQRFHNKEEFEPQLVTFNEYDQIFLERAYNIIENNITNQDFNIDTLCKELGVGRTRLFAKIKGIAGVTPNEFILNIRLKKAASLLKTQLTVAEIAYELGFNSPSYFIKCFKKMYNVTPAEKRKEKTH